MATQRIEYIDLAKGICIILVVIDHTCGALGMEPSICSDTAMAFRMPLYFILSGLFFSTYSGFKEFFIKKTNRLIIPFLFAWLLSCIYEWFKRQILNSAPTHSIWCGPYYEELANPPIWFLFCLFICALIFYWIRTIASRTKCPSLFGAILSLIVGCSGFFLGKVQINFPFWIDSAMTAIPFYAFGSFLRKNTRFLQNYFEKWKMLGLAIVLLVVTWLFGSYSRISLNDMSRTNIFSYYLCGITGTLAILYIAKSIKYIPWISYWGRYSICILVTHIYLVVAVNILLGICHIEITNRLIGCLICVPILGLYYFIIPVMIKYLPHVCAQKDLIKFTAKETPRM